MEKAHEVLQNTFGFSSFRLEQEAVIRRLLVDNDNALVLFPTGGGKSLTYQIPALCLEGLTLVISPLIALMKDQVDALVARGVKAANLDSTQGADRAAWIKGEVLSGNMKILYVAPERLNNEGFMAMMRRVRISLLAVDESHCISQWGASFRPEYLKIARFAEEMDVERVLCLTATATPSVAKDICDSFFIDRDAGVFRIPVYRPNLALKVEVFDNADQKIKRVASILKQRTGPAIVYVTLQKHAEEVSNGLRTHQLDVMIYHAGLPGEERERVQQQFMDSDQGIVVATIAFGMGIDKANIRQVIHFHMPKTLENYSQEVGRAGRDGLHSDCYMFLCAPDIPILEGFARGDTCAKCGIELWLQQVALQPPAPDGTLDFNHYKQAKEYDIRQNVLNLLYAQLELDYGYIRAVTPFYSIYDISSRNAAGWQKVLSDPSPTAVAIRTYWMTKSNGHTVDMVSTAEHSRIDRSELAKKINGWEMDGHIWSKASQVRARYMVMNPMPKSTKEIKALADALYQRMVAREDEAIEKIRKVIEFATNDDCMAQGLAAYFGDEDAVPDGMCGQCTFCLNGAGVDFSPVATSIPDPARIKQILDACPERDDPRLLARMAFGITSPRLTYGKWSTAHPLFGCMVDTDFSALVVAFDAECKKAGYTKVEAAGPTPRTSQKRSYTQTKTTSTSSYRGSYNRGGSSYGGGRGRGGSKRARR
ncbi:ATP-dependent DNA helicase [Lentinus tigrinus ALCF2SS1-7]|uniref:ATP-dependent DNA helicase n=1 Tax=Lentinus tigrinus ALCF2SS1-6 TaxID=1328759 RepID=A0A5C2RXU5_9APHY|nr:ATP-dependent DNA helicase [Lentinus tigrinus ALCF2SS1-6]RPD82451.1 ATP-dependent DNA helicase [Lentinus tigrinus ALCF2SS1-7]